MNFAQAHDRYLEPPDDDPVCEDGCGLPLTKDHEGGEWFCGNKFCPLNFAEGSIEREMAEMLIGAYEQIDSMRRRLQRLSK